MHKFILIIISLICSISGYSQQTDLSESFHESGKINVVLGVVLIIFFGIIFYLFRIDKKISKLEKDNE